MVSRSLSTALVLAVAFFVNTGAAMAGASDPTKIGDNTKGLLEPNAKSLWWVALVAGLLFMLFTRKASTAGKTAFLLVASGIAIWNPAGSMDMMAGIANRIL